MLPGLALIDIFYAVTGDAISVRQFATPHAVRELATYLHNILFRQLCIACVLAVGLITAASLFAICCVVRVRAKLQMRGIYASPVVALVANNHPLWDFPIIRQCPSNTMDVLMRAAYTPLPIPTRGYYAFPVPALIWLTGINVVPESLLWIVRAHRSAMSVYVLERFPLGDSLFGVRLCREVCLLSAAATAISVWYIIHVESPCRLGQSRSIHGAAGIFCCPNYNTGVV